MATAVLLVLTPAACLHGMWPSYLSHSLYTGNYDTLFITLHPPLARAFRDVGKIKRGKKGGSAWGGGGRGGGSTVGLICFFTCPAITGSNGG